MTTSNNRFMPTINQRVASIVHPTFKLHLNFSIFLAIFLLLTLSCAPSSPQVTPSKPIPSRPTSVPFTSSLRQLAQARGLWIGTTVNMDALQNDSQYRYILSNQFNMVTPEVSMKFDATEPRRGYFTFGAGDTLVAFAKQHNMYVRGHTLVWNQALPNWLTSGTFTRAELIDILREHIFAEVTHYRGQVNIWDVVNEAIDGAGGLRSTIWSQGIGSDYIDLAFQWAHQANPQAHLFYNDFDGEGSGRKSDAIYDLVKGLLQRGVPIYGVGMQMHVKLENYPRSQDVLANMRRLAALGLEVDITEMDVETQNSQGTMAQKLTQEAMIYRDMLAVCLAAPTCKAFVMWGFIDRYSWIPSYTHHPDAPLIFDQAYRPKLAYYALVDALTNSKK